MIVPLTFANTVAALVGALLIGTAAWLFLLLSGRIAGVSPLVARALTIADNWPPWIQSAAFIISLPAGTIAAWTLSGTPSLQVRHPAPFASGSR